MGKIFYNPKTGAMLNYSIWLERDPAYVVISSEEAVLMKHGKTYSDILKMRGVASSVALESQAAKCSTWNDKQVKPNEGKPDLSLSIDTNTARRMRKENAAAGEPDAFGFTKRVFAEVTHANATVEMLDGVKDEELWNFAKRAVDKTYPQFSEDMGEDERRKAYAFMRKDIAKIIRRRKKAMETNAKNKRLMELHIADEREDAQ